MDTWPVFPNISFATTREFFERVERDGRGPAGAGLRAELRVHRLLHLPDADQARQPLRREPPGRRRVGRQPGLAAPGPRLPGRAVAPGLARHPVLPLPRHPARLRRARHAHLRRRPLPEDDGDDRDAGDAGAIAAWPRRSTPPSPADPAAADVPPLAPVQRPRRGRRLPVGQRRAQPVRAEQRRRAPGRSSSSTRWRGRAPR